MIRPEKLKHLGKLLKCQMGATMIEFALLAPMFFLVLFGTIEGARVMWTQQTLDEVAYSTARCMSVSSACDTSAAQQSFAVARASGYGLSVSSASVTPQLDVTCRGFPNSSRVTITHTFTSVMDGFVPVFPAQLQVESCYPTLS